MSVQLIQQYYSTIDKLIQYGGSRNETAIRSAFQRLLEQYCSDRNLMLVTELDYRTKYDTSVNPDGTLKDALRQDWGYWESKDQYDNLDDEIEYKINVKGYPTSNILFEDGQTAVLIQNGKEVSRTEIKNPDSLRSLLVDFVSYEPKEVHAFREAIEKFKQDLPDLLTELRQLIEKQVEVNSAFAQARVNFLELCRQSINPHIVMADIREMIIQHVLTEDIFVTIFENAQFHQENNIALELLKVVKTFFTGAIRHNILIKIDPYIKVIKAAAGNICDHHEKQRFLKVVYENFYRTYSPAKADRLGIIYTPNEIVRFMVESADYLTLKHFGRTLGDNDVEILDPAAGTGTFITELIEYLPKNLIPYKYQNEIHCNEVAILPYYIANLNIEYTFAQKMGYYAEFKNICFVDTLDNLGFQFKNKQTHFLSISAENLERIQLQNRRKISVIIGNPPYNANQLNENENNKNRTYPFIDTRIKETYIKFSTAQKTKLYDMYARFIRWASERLAPNGIIAFVSNNSFIEARTYDGFRKVVQDEFNEIYVIDMKGNARTSGERRRREGGNVFTDEIRVGIAIYFLVRRQGAEGCRIYYNCVDDYLKAEAKKAYLRDNDFQKLAFTHIHPDKNHNWINLSENDWHELMPIATKQTKLAKVNEPVDSIFKLYSTGISTNRDEWIIDLSKETLRQKMKFFADFYNEYIQENDEYDTRIKWSRNLKQRYRKGLREKFTSRRITKFQYRPYCLHHIYYSDLFIDEHGLAQQISLRDNAVICFSGSSSVKPFQCLVTKSVPSLDLLEKTQCLPLYRYDAKGNRYDNITDWAVGQFQEHYQDKSISREAIFRYVYAVLHHPAYRKRYETNLKREYPHIPFYDGFYKWEGWGKQLSDLHLSYETAAHYPLERLDKESKLGKLPVKPKAKLKANKDASVIELDSMTTLRGIPKVAWEYKLGNRSALEWILEYYKERNPRDPSIRERFNTYRFADHKEQVIDLLARVCTVSVRTMEIIKEMELATD